MADEQVKTVRIVIDASKAKDGAADVEKALNSIDAKIEALGNSVGNAFNGLKNALLGFVSFDAIMTQVHGLTEAFDRLGSRAATLGVTTEWLQGFDFALASASVKLDEGGKALDKFNRLVGEGAQGNKAAVEVLDRLNVKILDANRQVRPLNDTFAEASAKIASMTGASEKNALAVQAMGKTAQLVVPALDAIGRGSDAMIEAGKKAGAIVSRESIAIWEGLAAAADKSMIAWRSFAGENFAESVKKGFDLITDAIGGALGKLKEWGTMLLGLWDQAKAFAREQSQVDIRTKLLPDIDSMIRLQSDRVTAAAAKINAVPNVDRQENLVGLQEDLTRNNPTDANKVLLEKLRTDYESARIVREKTLTEAQKVYEDAEGMLSRAIAYRQNTVAQLAKEQNGNTTPSDFLNGVDTMAGGGGSIVKPPAQTTGAFGATASDGGAAAQAAADRQNKRIEALKAEADATGRMAAKALEGAAAVNEEEANFKALQQALEVVGDKAKASDPKVQALQKTFKDLNQTIAENTGIKTFRLQTEELARQNDVAQKRLELYGQAPEIIAREVGLMQARNEVAKTGIKLSDDDLAARAKVLETQDLLNQRLQQAQQQQELWLQPLKSALSAMQQGLAGFFEQLFTGGINSWQKFVDSMKSIFIKMLAELAAVAVLRPIIAPIIAGGQGAGLISPGVASSLGYPTIGSTPGNAGGGFTMPGGFGGGGFGGLSGSLGSFGQWLNTPFTGPYAGISPAAMEGVPMLSGAAGAGLTPLGAAAGIGSIGFGAYNLLTSHSLGGQLGGAAGILGGGLSLAASAGLIGSAFGPIGMGIGLLGGMLLPGLLGGEEKKPPRLMATGGLNFSGGQFNYSGSQYNGGQSLAGPLGSTGNTMKMLLDASGVSSTASSNSLNYQTLSVGDFKNATTFVNGQQWGQSSEGDAGLDTAAAHVAHQIMMEAGSGISAIMRQGLGNYGQQNLDHAFSTQELGTAVSAIKAFDDAMKNLGKTTTTAEAALKAIDDQFKPLTDTAKLYGLDTTKVDAEQAKAKAKVGSDFADSIQRQIDDRTDPSKGLLADLEKAKQAAIDNDAFLVANVSGTLSQINNIEALYGAQRADIVAKAAADAAAQAQGYHATMIQFSDKDHQDTFAYYQSLQKLGDTFAGFAKNADALGLSLNQIGADYLKAFTALGTERQKQLDATAFAKFQFFDGIAQQQQAITNPTGATLTGLARSRDLTIKSAQDQWGNTSPEALQAAIAASNLYLAQVKAMNDNFRAGLDAMSRDLEAPGVANIQNIMDARAKDIATATALDGPGFDGLWRVGANVEAAMKAWNAKIFKVADDFAYSISQGLLAFSDPLQAQINDLDKQRDEAIATAKANNAAVAQVQGEIAARAQALDDIRTNDLWSVKEITDGAAIQKRALTDIEMTRISQLTAEADLAKSTADQVGQQLAATGNHYVELADVTELYLKREVALKEQYLAQSLGSLEAFIKRVTYGDLAGLSPTATLDATRGAYAAARAQVSASPTDQASIDSYTLRAGELGDALNKYYDGASSDYNRAIAQLRTDAVAVDTGAGGNGGAPLGAASQGGGAAVSADVAALQATVATLVKTLQDNEQQQAETLAVLKRMAVYS